MSFRSRLSELPFFHCIDKCWIHFWRSAGRAWHTAIAKELDPMLSSIHSRRTTDLADSNSDKTVVCLRFGSTSPHGAINSFELTLTVEFEARALFFLLKTLADMA